MIEGVARGVEQQGGPVVVQAQAEVEVRIVAVDVGAPPPAVALAVDQAVLDRERRPAGVADLGGRGGGVEGEGAVGMEQLGGAGASLAARS